MPGTPQAQRAGDWIVQMMKARADTVIEQRWTHTHRGRQAAAAAQHPRALPSAGDAARALPHALGHAARSPTRIRSSATAATPIPGANDGAAGVGLFIALGDALKKTPPSVGVDLLFVDGEDYGKSFDAPYTDVLLGSQYFAEHLPSPDYKPDLRRPVGHDRRRGPEHPAGGELDAAGAGGGVARVAEGRGAWATSSAFIPRAGYDVTDDHVPLLKKGLRVIDVIDLDYGPLGPDGAASPNYHHTMQDTIDKVSAKSLQTVGDVALGLITDS